jgi:fluoride exporter
MISMILVALGGMAGALSRFFIQRAMQTKVIPVSTITVNLLGSFLLGWIVGKGIQGDVYLLTATGFMGSFTTFSTLNVDIIKLISSKQKKSAIIYFFSTYIGGLLCAVAGMLAGRLI